MPKQTVLHLLYRFDIGGLESVLVNLLNNLPAERFNHVIVSLTDVNAEFAQRLNQPVEIIALHKPPGNSLKVYKQLWQIIRQYRPDIVHSYNLATLEYQIVSALAGINRRIHAEHGRDIHDLEGANKKYQLLRRLINPFIHDWIPVSQELANWLVQTVKIPSTKVKLIYNGIDLTRYKPVPRSHDIFVIGTVGRAAVVKNQLCLIKAVESMITKTPALKNTLQLWVVGDGELFSQLQDYVQSRQLQDTVKLLGARHDVADILEQLDLFVLPSLTEGIALTLLEAMASGLPVIATQVGGNPELIDDDVNGRLVPVRDEQALAECIVGYLNDPLRCQRQGLAARAKVEKQFSLQAMMEQYFAIYQN